jgi:hypothetical protein
LQEDTGSHGGFKMRDIDSYMGDEPEIDAELRERQESYYEEHADDFKYTEEWLNG